MEKLRAERDRVARVLAESSSGQEAAASSLQERDNQVTQLLEQLAVAESKIQELTNAPETSKPGDEEQAAEFESRIKVLEDNLAQMNAYADHLEIVISQCPACSAKVQTGSTQDFENKAA
ncbi:hypothetical protein PybrP1_005703 [[Pythium] brassicae (nom. inval.)]|nr:hypothetical protein PybrP1_005703 [[Pythium] brassicae (nom. inval.)]